MRLIVIMRRVVVTGLGLVTPLAVGATGSWSALLQGRSGALTLQGDRDGHPAATWNALPSRVAALVPRGTDGSSSFDRDAFDKSSEARIMSLAMKYGLVAAKEALEDSGWDPSAEEVEERNRAGVAVGMSLPDLDYVSQNHSMVSKGKMNRVGPYFVPRLLTNLSAGHIAIQHGLGGPNHSVSTACATGSHAIGDAFSMIRAGSAELMVCGGVEACVTPLVMAGFCRARALSTKYNDRPEEASRPFDEDRDGFVIGEGAGILVLEELEHALARKCPKIYGEVVGYGLSGDAFHVTSGREDGAGALRAMRDAVRQAGGKKALDNICFINAHATSTPKGDIAEMKAIDRLLEGTEARPHITSNKGHVGHLLGAAGSVESAFALLSLREGVVPKTRNYSNRDEEIPRGDSIVNKNVTLESDSKSENYVLKNSFGFGGTNVSLMFRSYRYEL